MIKNCLPFLLLILIFSCTPAPSEDSSNRDNADPQIETQIDALLKNMTLEEKIGQTALRGTSSRVKGSLPEELKEAVRNGQIGAFLNVMKPEYVDELQRIAVEESPNGIPLIFARDVIHGFKTIFPIPLGLTASWEPEQARIAARSSAKEATQVGVRWTFAPMVDICRDSRWGRIAESPGEDPYLASLFSAAYIHGFQGDSLSQPDAMAACVKHFAAYGAAIGGRDYNSAEMHESQLRNFYLPPFEAAFEAKAATVMTSFNDLNGVPASANPFLLKDILRGEYGFDGFVVSDWNSVTEMIPHGFAKDKKEAARLSMNGGMEMEMTSDAYELNLLDLIKTGRVSEEDLDDAVRNILRIKIRLGLFDQPYRATTTAPNYYAEEDMQAARVAAEKSSVLLENNNILPLSSKSKIALIGPLADQPHEQLGTWTFDGEKEMTKTVKAAFEENDINFDFAEGLEFSRSNSKKGFAKAIRIAKDADVIVFVGGEEAILSGEAHSRGDIRMPGAQEALLNELSKTGKPIVLVLMAGRPLDIEDIKSHADAILMMWHPGTMGGPALCNLLYGQSSPEGRLPVTWPKDAGQLPLYYNHNNTGRPADSSSFVQMNDIPVGAWQSSLGNNSHYLDFGFTPAYPFGYGLTYTSFNYSDLIIEKDELKRTDTLMLSVMLENTGSYEGVETVQLYIQDRFASSVRPVKELKAFRKVSLEKGAQKRIRFELPVSELSFIGHDIQAILEAGDFYVWLGANATEGIRGSFKLVD